MPWYELTKVLHYIGFITLIGFFIVYTRVRITFASAKTTREAHQLVAVLDASRGMLPAGSAILLLSGIIMTGMRWRSPYAFPIGGIVTLLVITPVAMSFLKKQIATMRAALGAGDAGLSDAMRAAINTPRQWGMMMACNLAVAGTLLIMTLKPGWMFVTGVLVVFPIFGYFLGASMAERASKRSLPKA